MKTFFYNLGYFFGEAKKIFRLNLLSNIFSLLSTVLIFFLLGLVVTGWTISSQVVEMLQEEAQVDLYLEESYDETAMLKKVDEIMKLPGVTQARRVDEKEAYGRMEDILGEEAVVLGYFDENPFGAFIEVNVELEKVEAIMAQLQQVEGVEHIRDNGEILDKLRQISSLMQVLGFLVLAAVGVTTFVIISHIIRQGIYHHRETINTLELLGAPKHFVNLPFFIEGILITLFGGIAASGLLVLGIGQFYEMIASPLPFLPLPKEGEVIRFLVVLLVALSAGLGVLGSAFGLKSSRRKRT